MAAVPTLGLAMAVALVSGCAAVDLDVIRPVPLPVRAVALTVRDETPGDMSADDTEGFQIDVERGLESAGIAVVGAGTRGALRVVGSVVRYDPGIRALRYVSGYGLGTGSLVSTWEVWDTRGRTVARCRIEGTVSTGTFGGSIGEVQEETGRALARFLHGGVH
jgi:hypothetical protein